MTDPTPWERGQPTPRLNAALVAVQAELPTIEKNKTVEVEKKTGGTYSYSYAPLDKVAAAIYPLLAKNGLAFSAFPGLGDDGKLSLNYTLLHTSGEERSGAFPLSAEGGIQVLGGRITYARRYCLTAVVGLVVEDDDDGERAESSGAPSVARRAPARARAAAKPRAERVADDPNPPDVPEAGGDWSGTSTDETGITQPQQQRLIMQFKELGVTERDRRLAAISQVVGRVVDSMTTLTKDEAHQVIEFAQARIDGTNANAAPAEATDA